jgi:hypothetical protein
MEKKYLMDEGSCDSNGSEPTEALRFNSLRSNDELFDDEKCVVHSLVSVRRTKSSKNGENWKVLEDGRVSLIIRGKQLNKHDREFLRGVEGVRFVISEYKAGNKSALKLKKKIKEHVENNYD